MTLGAPRVSTAPDGAEVVSKLTIPEQGLRAACFSWSPLPAPTPTALVGDASIMAMAASGRGPRGLQPGPASPQRLQERAVMC